MRKVLYMLTVAMLVLGATGAVTIVTTIDSPVIAAAKDNGNDHGKAKGHDKQDGNDGGEEDNEGEGNDGETDSSVSTLGADPTPSSTIDPDLAALVNPSVMNATGNQIVVVRIIDHEFVPAQITVRTGDFVVFVNLDETQHAVIGEEIDTGTIEAGQSAVATFDTPGAFSFACSLHPEMTGAVTVEPQPTPTQPAERDATSPASSETTAAAPIRTGPAATATPVTDAVEVEIDNLTFLPATVTVAPGTTVRWLNDDGLPHTVTGDWGDSGNIAPGQSFEWTFAEDGTYPYRCDYYPDMTGQVVVSNS